MISYLIDLYKKIKRKFCTPKRNTNLSKELLKRSDSIFDL